MKSKIHISLIIFVFLFCILNSVSYVFLEQNIYFWDYSGYWHIWEKFLSVFKENPKTALGGLIVSIQNEDYNQLPTVVPALFSFFLIPGIASRTSYIVSLVLVYFVPLVFLFEKIYNYFRQNRSVESRILLTVIPLTYTAFWIPTLRGYPDICGLNFIIFTIFLLLKIDLSKKINIKYSVLLGVCILAPFLFRRWYAYTIISLYISSPFLNYFVFYKCFFQKKKIYNLLANFLIAGFSSIILAVIFQGPLLKRIIITNYSLIYSAYQLPFFDSVENLIKNMGVYMIPIFLASFLFFSLTLRKNKKEFLFSLFCIFNLFVSFFLFTRTQSPGMQHDLPFSLWFVFVSGLGLDFLINKIRNKIISFIVMIMLTGGVFYTYSSTFFVTHDWKSFWVKIMPPKALPLHVDNFDAYQKLVSDLQKITSDNSKVTILSSNGNLNEEMIDSLSNHSLVNHITFTSQVDLRDKIRGLPYMSRYFVITDPVQIHLGESGQRVITIPSEEILNGKGIGKAFSKTEYKYKIAGNISVIIYEKNRRFMSDEIKYIFDNFYQYYPDWRNIYRKNLVEAYFSSYNVNLGDQWGQFELSDRGSVLLHPGSNYPTEFSWILNGIDYISAKSINMACNKSDKILLKLGLDRNEMKSIFLKKGEETKIDVRYLDGKISYFSIEKVNSSDCDAVEISQ